MPFTPDGCQLVLCDGTSLFYPDHEPSVCRIVRVASNEPPNGLGDSDTAPEWVITGDLTVALRAARSGIGNGRIYTLEIACEDGSGNVATTNVALSVPHDREWKRHSCPRGGVR